MKTTMKNTFKFGFLAMALSLGAAACSSNQSGDNADTTEIDTATTIDTPSTTETPYDSVETDTTQ